MRSTILILIAALGMAGCSDDDTSNNAGADSGAVKKDRSISVKDRAVTGKDGAAKADKSTKTCGPGIYPCGPYGKKASSVLANLQFMGYADPKDACKDHKDKKLNMSKAVPISPKTFYQGDKSCPAKKKKLLWILGSAGWCGICVKEVKTIQAALNANQLSKDVVFWNVLVDGKTVSGPPSDALLQSWLSTVNGTFPAAYDLKRVLAGYFTASYFPFNMLVDLSNMKIIYAKNGDKVSTIGTKIQQFLAGK